MSSVKYSFDGQHSRKPEQSYGGKGTTELTRALLLERAKQERLRREESRLRAHSILVIQSAVRSLLTRLRLKNRYREIYNDNSNAGNLDTLEHQRLQIFLLTQFFDEYNPSDGEKYCYHVKKFLEVKTEVAELCCLKPIWSLRIRNFIRIGLTWYTGVDDLQRSTTHRPAIEFLHVLSENCGTSIASIKFLSTLWMDLTLSFNFFEKWRVCSENIFRFSPLPYTSDLPDSFPDLITTLKLPFRVISNLKNISPSCVIRKGLYCGTEKWWGYGKTIEITVGLFQQVIFEKFTISFVECCMPRVDTNISQEYVLSQLSNEFPSAQYADYVRNFYIVMSPLGTSEIRNVLKAALILHSPDKRLDEQFYHTAFIFVTALISAIDERYVPYCIRDKEYVENLYGPMSDLVHNPSIPREVYEYARERDTLMVELKRYMLALPIAEIINSIPLRMEEITLILGTLIRNDYKRASINFPFLNKLAYNRQFMRRLYEAVVVTNDVKTFNDAVSISYMMFKQMQTLHDGEFLCGNSLSKDELMQLILYSVKWYAISLKATYSLTGGENKKVAEVISRTLMSLYDRNLRLQIFPEEIFLSTDIIHHSLLAGHSISFDVFLEGLKGCLTPSDEMLFQVLHEYPFALTFRERVTLLNRMLFFTKRDHGGNLIDNQPIVIRRSRLYEDTYQLLSFENMPHMRDPLRIIMENNAGLREAGIDGGGLLREFLSEATKAGVDPNRGLFRLDASNRAYPNPIAKNILDDYKLHYFLIGRLVGKGLYEQTFIDIPFAGFFIQKCVTPKLNSATDFLATVDPALHKHLLSLKTYSGDFNSLGLDFSLNVNELGVIRTVELKENGSSIAVDKANVIEYIHLVADYKMNKEVADECASFREGILSVVPVLSIFSWRELQTLISGSEHINIKDWKENTNYTLGFTSTHHSIEIFWKVVESFDESHLRKLLKFVTSCSRPPLLGFKELNPNFGIQSAGRVLNLPTASTCLNLLKLPEFDDAATLQAKLLYAIDAEAGFELS